MSMLGQGRKAIDQVGDPRKGIVGYVQITQASTDTAVSLYDYQGNAFSPSTTNPFGLKDILVKNTGTATTQWTLKVGTQTFAIFYCSAEADVKISFNGLAPVWTTLNAQNDLGVGHITVVGVQN